MIQTNLRIILIFAVGCYFILILLFLKRKSIRAEVYVTLDFKRRSAGGLCDFPTASDIFGANAWD